MVTPFAAATDLRLAPSETSGGRGTGLERVYLAPGRLYASDRDAEVTTILGSCVSACLWDGQAGIGGINHFLLPSGAPPSPRFGDTAMAGLFALLLDLGAQRARLAAKLFGGACVLEAFRGESASLGLRNVEMAREWLDEAGIPVVGEDVGGRLGRKLVFRVRTGAARVRAIEMKA